MGNKPAKLGGTVFSDQCTGTIGVTAGLLEPYEIYPDFTINTLALGLERKRNFEYYSYTGIGLGSATFRGINVSVDMRFTDAVLQSLRANFSYVNNVVDASSSLNFSPDCSMGRVAYGSGSANLTNVFNVNITLNTSMSYFTGCGSNREWDLTGYTRVNGLVVFGIPLDADLYVGVSKSTYVHIV